MTDSSTGGALAPTSVAAPEENALDDLFTGIFGGLAGIDPTLVRPRFQPTPIEQPTRTTNWLAMGVITTGAMGYSQQSWKAGAYVLIQHETLEVTCSFYGPNARDNAAYVRDGLDLAQNREALQAAGVSYVNSMPMRRLPDLVNQGWVNRADITFHFRRRITRTYPVRSLVETAGDVLAGTRTQPFASENVR